MPRVAVTPTDFAVAERSGRYGQEPRGTRLASVDLLRGVVMVLMVLDHTRDFFDIGVNPFDPSRPGVFLTRWVTNFCAPVFVFLAGTGAYLAGARGRSRVELARFLLVRGLFLLVLEVSLVKFGILFRVAPQMYFAQVIWVIGWSMIVLAGLIFLPLSVIALFGAAMVGLHNLTDGVQADDLGPLRPVWMILHQPGLVQSGYGFNVFVLYCLIPWVGVMALGYAFGSLLGIEPARRRRVLITLGLALTAAFVAIRATNLYGNPQPWTRQPSALATILAFLNCQKYPPSLLFLLMTLGPAIAALGLFDRGGGAIGRPLVTLGRVPLLFYLLQWYVVHGLAVAVTAARGQPVDWLFIYNLPFQAPAEARYTLPAVYVMWIVSMLLLYPACHWFARLKERRRDAWLSYL